MSAIHDNKSIGGFDSVLLDSIKIACAPGSTGGSAIQFTRFDTQGRPVAALRVDNELHGIEHLPESEQYRLREEHAKVTHVATIVLCAKSNRESEKRKVRIQEIEEIHRRACIARGEDPDADFETIRANREKASKLACGYIENVDGTLSPPPSYRERFSQWWSETWLAHFFLNSGKLSKDACPTASKEGAAGGNSPKASTSLSDMPD